MRKSYLDTLTSEQMAVVSHGCVENSAFPAEPLLVLAGAGTGKTETLAMFAAHRVNLGADPSRILILAFNRSAAREIKQRVTGTVRASTGRRRNTWLQCDTFHATALRLVRRYASRLGLESNFTIQDRPSNALLMDHVLAQQKVPDRGFPEAEECLKIYSYRANALISLKAVLSDRYPEYVRFGERLANVLRAYDQAKIRDQVVDFDDLLILLDRLLHRSFADRVRALFDYVLVDEYQDTTPLQDRILQGLRPDGRGLVLVGDDDQCIYGFRGVTPQLILDRAKSAKVLKLTQSHRSPQPILDACNAVIARAGPTAKTLWSKDKAGPKPKISVVRNDLDQVRCIVKRIEAAQAAGVSLRDQAVLARTAKETGLLEAELTRLGIPYRKNGGSPLLDHAGLKTALALLNWCENPKDGVAGAVALQAMPGIGSAAAFRIAHSLCRGLDRRRFLALRPAAVKKRLWAAFADLVVSVDKLAWNRQVPTVCRWLRKIGGEDELSPKRVRTLIRVAQQYRTRGEFLAAVSLRRADGAPARISEKDRLTISTIHSAKGLEWTAVYVINAVEGCIPSRLARNREEERRLLFVSMTRAKRHLELLAPKRLRSIGNGSIGLARTSFISRRMLPCFELG